MKRGGVDCVQEQRRGGTCGVRGALKLRIGNRQQCNHGDRADARVELPGGQKLLGRRMAEIEKQSFPALGVQAA